MPEPLTPRHAVLLGTYDPTHTRNRVIRTLLTHAGWRVTECRREVWGRERFSAVHSGRARLAVRALSAYFALIARSITMRRPTLVVVGFPGHIDMLILAPVWRLRRVPVVFDPLLALEDTVVADRGLADHGSMTARGLRIVDRLAFGLASRILVDTPEVGDLYRTRYGADPTKLVVVWPGTDTGALGNRTAAGPGHRVLFHGSYIPLHGIDTIVRAADQVRDSPLQFRLIGTGQLRDEIENLVAQLGGVPNLTFLDRMSLSEIGDEIRAASMCLGIFGTTEKAARVVPFKIFEYLALGRPIITGSTPAARAALGDCVRFVPVGDPEALAAALVELDADGAERLRLAAAAAARFDDAFSTEAQAVALDRALGTLARAPRQAA